MTEPEPRPSVPVPARRRRVWQRHPVAHAGPTSGHRDAIDVARVLALLIVVLKGQPK